MLNLDDRSIHKLEIIHIHTFYILKEIKERKIVREAILFFYLTIFKYFSNLEMLFFDHFLGNFFLLFALLLSLWFVILLHYFVILLKILYCILIAFVVKVFFLRLILEILDQLLSFL